MVIRLGMIANCITWTQLSITGTYVQSCHSVTIDIKVWFYCYADRLFNTLFCLFFVTRTCITYTTPVKREPN